MIAWILRHPKTFFALVSGSITVIIAPAILGAWGFFLTTSKTNATVPENSKMIQELKLEWAADRAVNNERWRIVTESLKIIQDREYNELKEARQRRLQNP